MYYARCTNVKKMNCDKCVPVHGAQAPVHCTAQASKMTNLVVMKESPEIAPNISTRSFV